MGRRKKRDLRAAETSATPGPSVVTFGSDTPLESPQEIPQDNPPQDSQEPEIFPRPQSKEKISWPIDGGKFDVTSFQKETGERAKNVARSSFLDSDFRKWAGIEEATASIAEGIFPPQLMGQFLDLAASCETLFMAQKTGLTFDECSEFMKWKANEHEVLDAQGARLARQHLDTRWLQKMDLYMWLGSVALLSAGKMRMCQDYAAKRLEEIGKAKTPGPVAPPPQTVSTDNGATPINIPPPPQQWPTNVEGKSLE